MQEIYSSLFGIGISQGTLVKIVHRFAGKASGIYETLRRRVSQSPVVGADETGICISGKNHWGWTFRTPEITLISVDRSRGKPAIDRNFKDGFPRLTLVHDCWKPYFVTTATAHQICTAHLLRDLKYLEKLYSDQWISFFKSLLLDALLLKKELSEIDYLYPIAKRQFIEERLDELLQSDINEKHKKLVVFRNRMILYRKHLLQFLFRNRMILYRKHLLQFLYKYNVPPDNNSSERTIRNFKVKQKISGLFRSFDGANDFAVIRSVIDTTIKNSQNVLNAIICVAGDG